MDQSNPNDSALLQFLIDASGDKTQCLDLQMMDRRHVARKPLYVVGVVEDGTLLGFVAQACR
jgi:hypothetical protein